MRCGLLGRKLSHSYSPQIHSLLGSYNYGLFEKEPDELESFLLGKDFDALNVTIPYKKDVLPFCTELSPVAQALGSVNTIVRGKDGRLIGHNSDFFGFQSMVRRTGLELAEKKVLVLGSGGAAVTVCAVLKRLQARVVQISRTGENHYGNLHLHTDAAAIVNATPVGMYPETDSTPVDIALFPYLEGVLDLIYNPAETRLLAQARKRGLVAENGLWMLVAQAFESAQWFTGSTLPERLIGDIYHTLSRRMKNIVLIGMPGCGKSTVGKLLAQLSGRSFIDADAEIEKQTGISIPEIFEHHGQEAFRQLETRVLARICKESGCVIATGGGCVTKPENYNHLHQNSTVVWIKRPLTELAVDGRPLSQSTSVEAMYAVRKPMYEAFADVTVQNTTPGETAERILSLMHGG